jgi:hypothetical protein
VKTIFDFSLNRIILSREEDKKIVTKKAIAH